MQKHKISSGFNVFFTENCACCDQELTSQQPIEILNCCSTDANVKAVHKSCLQQSLEPTVITEPQPNVGDTTLAQPTSMPTKCPCCGHKLRNSSLNAEQSSLLAEMDSVLAKEIKNQLSLSEVETLFSIKAFTQQHFLARYGSQLPISEVIRLLNKEAAFTQDFKRVLSILPLLAEHHRAEVFEHALNYINGFDAIQGLCITILKNQLLVTIRTNTDHNMVMFRMLIKKLLSADVYFDPMSNLGHEFWSPYAERSKILLEELSRKNSIRHQFTLARVYQHGVYPGTAIRSDAQLAFKHYWQVIECCLQKTQPLNSSLELPMLEVACQYVIEHLGDNNELEKSHLIQAVHLLTGHSIHRLKLTEQKFEVDPFANQESLQPIEILNYTRNPSNCLKLLIFIYNDFLRKGATPEQFAKAYDALRDYYQALSDSNPSYKDCKAITHAKNVQLGNLLHLVAEYWPAIASVKSEDIVLTMQRLLDEGDKSVLVAFSDSKGNQILHIVAYHWLKNNRDVAKTWAVIQMLISAGADINAAGHDGIPLTHIIMSEWLNYIEYNQLHDMIEYCLSNGAGVDDTDPSDDTLLHNFFWTWGKKLQLPELKRFCELMSKYKANFSATNSSEQTPLFSVFTHCNPENHAELVAIFLKFFKSIAPESTNAFDAALHAQDIEDFTVLHLAASHSTSEVFQDLLGMFPAQNVLNLVTANPDTRSATTWRSVKPLFASITRNKDHAVEILTGLLQHLLQIMLDKDYYLNLTTHHGLYFWRNLSGVDIREIKLDGIEILTEVITKQGTAQDAFYLAQYYLQRRERLYLIMYTPEQNLELAGNAYALVLKKLFTEQPLLSPQDLEIIRGIMPSPAYRQYRNTKFLHYLTDNVWNALGLLLDVNQRRENTAKGIQKLEYLSKFGTISESILASSVLGHYYALSVKDYEKAIGFFKVVCDQQSVMKTSDPFAEACRLDAMTRLTEFLSTGVEDLRLNLLCKDATQSPHDLVKQYCQVLLRADLDLQYQAVESLCSLPQLFKDKDSRVTLLNTLIEIVNNRDNDPDFVIHLLRSLQVEELFLKGTYKPKQQSSFSLSIFTQIWSDDTDEDTYTTDMAVVYLDIFEESRFEALKARFARTKPEEDEPWITAVDELLKTIDNVISSTVNGLTIDILGRCEELRKLSKDMSKATQDATYQ